MENLSPATSERLAQANIRKLTAEAFALERDNDQAAATADENRIYTFTGKVDRDSVSYCIDDLAEWSRRWPGAEFTIIFNSYGGTVFDGLALFDYLRELGSRGHTVTTVGQGAVFSMGGILLQAGTKREMTPRSYLMLHEISTGMIGKTSEIEDELKLLNRIEDQVLDIFAERSRLSRATLKRRWRRKDWFMDAKEALKDGFIDGIRDGSSS